MNSTIAPSRPANLRQVLQNHKSVVVTFLALVLTTAVVAKASAAGGVSTVCLSTEAASNQNGGWNSPAIGPDTQSKQKTLGGTRRETLWSGPVQECPANASSDCTLRYDKGQSQSYSKVINISGGLGATGGAIPVPFPIISATGSVVNETRTTSWDVSNAIMIHPGQRANPALVVDYQEWRGDFVGGYMHDGEQGCHQYHLEPNMEFGNWHGEVATTDITTWNIN